MCCGKYSRVMMTIIHQTPAPVISPEDHETFKLVVAALGFKYNCYALLILKKAGGSLAEASIVRSIVQLVGVPGYSGFPRAKPMLIEAGLVIDRVDITDAHTLSLTVRGARVAAALEE